jgi:hypothetical protein
VGGVLAIFAFVGFESAGSLGREARNPKRTIGRAVLWSAGLVGLLYVFVVYTQVYGFSGTEPGFAKSTAPLPELADIVHLPVLAPIVGLGIVCSMFACTLACINAASRVLYTMAQDGLAGQRLARVAPPPPHPAPGDVDGGRAHARGAGAVPAAGQRRDSTQRMGRSRCSGSCSATASRRPARPGSCAPGASRAQ